jgi:hypothetical protein
MRREEEGAWLGCWRWNWKQTAAQRVGTSATAIEQQLWAEQIKEGGWTTWVAVVGGLKAARWLGTGSVGRCDGIDAG